MRVARLKVLRTRSLLVGVPAAVYAFTVIVAFDLFKLGYAKQPREGWLWSLLEQRDKPPWFTSLVLSIAALAGVVVLCTTRELVAIKHYESERAKAAADSD